VFALHRDKNGAETDETDWWYICFHFFFAKVEIDTKILKTNRNQILLETDMDQKRRRHEQKEDVHQNQEIS
jgi:hypothetical protein